ncbi:MAG: indolepyruvate oxidoreductase subunit beta, partial [Candidatus Adiutrix sp.]|nr:indolepyruvate oxidoreductase subunit beta [Candidatus Adiutrix sp.]
MTTKNILLVGVGGQGAILTSKILVAGLISEGYDVKMSEIHGMSQRGGTVTTQVRYGEKVWAPNISLGEADIIVSFEKVEALRALPYLKPGGTIVTDEHEIYSMPVS